jgi:hypothetical protein
MLSGMPLRRTGHLAPEDLLTTSAEARSYLWSVLLTFPAFVVFLVAGISRGSGVSGVQVIALFVFMAGAVPGNLLINRIVRRLGRPRSVLAYHLLRNRVGFALWRPSVVRHAKRLARRSGDELW